MNSLEWSSGMERWSGVLDWSTGAVAQLFSHVSYALVTLQASLPSAR